jgi:hypothetical protein
MLHQCTYSKLGEVGRISFLSQLRARGQPENLLRIYFHICLRTASMLAQFNRAPESHFPPIDFSKSANLLPKLPMLDWQLE